MTHTYAAIKLLEHGPLTSGQLMDITGWPHSSLWNVLYNLIDEGVVIRKSMDGRIHFGLVKC